MPLASRLVVVVLVLGVLLLPGTGQLDWGVFFGTSVFLAFGNAEGGSKAIALDPGIAKLFHSWAGGRPAWSLVFFFFFLGWFVLVVAFARC